MRTLHKSLNQVFSPCFGSGILTIAAVHPLCSPTEFILISISSQSSLQQRHCAYHVTSKKSEFTTAGNVSGSVQLCKNTQCCVGYYIVISGHLKVDVLGEEIQPGRTGLD